MIALNNPTIITLKLEEMAEYDNAGSVIDQSNIPVSDYFDYQYKKYVLINCKYNTQLSYRLVIDRHIKTSLGIYKLKSLKPATLQDFLNSKYKNGYAKIHYLIFMVAIRQFKNFKLG